MENSHVEGKRVSKVKRTPQNPLNLGDKGKQRRRDDHFKTIRDKERRKASKKSHVKTLSKIESIESIEEEKKATERIEGELENEFLDDYYEARDIVIDWMYQTSRYCPICHCPSCDDIICDYDLEWKMTLCLINTLRTERNRKFKYGSL